MIILYDEKILAAKRAAVKIYKAFITKQSLIPVTKEEIEIISGDKYLITLLGHVNDKSPTC